MADVCAATGAKDSDEALGKIRAGQVAIGERDGLQKALQSQAAASLQKEFRSELKSALKEGRLTLGELATVIPAFMKDDEGKKALAALEQVKSQDRKELLDAVCQGQIGPKSFARVKAFIGTRQAQAVVPAPAVQPPLTEETAAKVTQVSDEQVKAIANATGIPAERAAKLAAVKSDSVSDYVAALSK